jgi:hypothetical protein
VLSSAASLQAVNVNLWHWPDIASVGRSHLKP